MTGGRCSIRLTRRFPASPQEVWAALTDRSAVARWLARPVALDLSPDGRFELELPDGTRFEGSVRRIERERLLEMDWCGPGEDPSVVRFILTADRDGTLLVLEHDRLEERFGMRYMRRWSTALVLFARVIAR